MGAAAEGATLCRDLLGFAGPHFGWLQWGELPGEASYPQMTLEPLCLLATQLGHVRLLATAMLLACQERSC